MTHRPEDLGEWPDLPVLGPENAEHVHTATDPVDAPEIAQIGPELGQEFTVVQTVGNSRLTQTLRLVAPGELELVAVALEEVE